MIDIQRLKQMVKSIPLFARAWTIVRGIVYGPLRVQVFSIAVYGGDGPLDLAPMGNPAGPVLTAADVTDLKAEFIADPFLLRKEEGWYLFFEVLPSVRDGRERKGVIGLATSQDAGLSWSYEQVVLREPFHLSYPHVFEWEGKVYMIPEAQQSGAIRLYRASNFPTGWEHVANLLEGDFTDATPFFKDGTWWLFAEALEAGLRGMNDGENSILRLFFADTLTGPWLEHPMSPIVVGDARAARPAGRMISTDTGRLMRLAQDCTEHYGAAVYAFEIEVLTRDEYREFPASVFPVLAGTGQGWNASGMHHLDLQEDDGRWIAVVDGWHYSTRA